jgi:uncharacterized repeat protein (TIGR03803 family)
VFKLDPSGHYTVLDRFTGLADGGFPFGDLVRDRAGNLYGATGEGGAANKGVVYKLDATGHETVLHSFTGGADGWRPRAGGRGLSVQREHCRRRLELLRH